MKAPHFIDAGVLKSGVSPTAAADALEVSLTAGLDPEAGLDRMVMELGSGQLLVMPAATGEHATVKLATVGGDPRIQGIAVVFDSSTLTPVAAIDAVALTELRTAALSLVAVRHMLRGAIEHLVIFGRGPQGLAHGDLLTDELDPSKVTMLDSTSTGAEVSAAVRSADLICCATTARDPLFDGALVADSAIIVAVGSHEPTARELDEGLMRRATVVVESRRSALREAGDVLMADLPGSSLINLRELVAGAPLPSDRPCVFKSTGMSWEDAVVAASLVGDGLLDSLG